MDAIGFKNFRKFEDFPMIELGGVNVFVGPNNSGKSTAIKAIRLFFDNMLCDKNVIDSYEQKRIINFYGIVGWPIVSCIDFSDVVHDSSVGSGGIVLSGRLGKMTLKVILRKANELPYDAKADKFVIESAFDLGEVVDAVQFTGQLKPVVKKQGDDYVLKYYYSILLRDGALLELEECVKKGKTPEYYRQMIKCIRESHGDCSFRGTCPNKGERGTRLEHRNNDGRFFVKAVKDYGTSQQGMNNGEILFLVREGGSNDLQREIIKKMLGALDNTIQCRYIETFSASHKKMLDSSQKDNYLAQVVKEYYATGLHNKDVVVKWLKEFQIGADFKIEQIDRELYKVKIKDMSGSWFPLAHKGTGSIHLFILLLQVALAQKKNGNTMILVEEPEQNLHPALQSKLADLFCEVNMETEGKVRFAVETHSEYLVRRMQVITAENVYKGQKTIDEMNEIFKVYYFPEEGLPYDMKFKENGHFERKFGPGFFDVAGSSFRSLMRIGMED